MLGAICFLFGVSCLYFGTVRPVYRSSLKKRRRLAYQAYKAQQMLAVRNYYPGLEKLTPAELREAYDVEMAYNMIGRCQ